VQDNFIRTVFILMMLFVKTISNYLLRLVIYVSCLNSLNAQSQGRVVINEFMSWSGCNTNSEFIELMNFGPGPMNIGCYIVTNGRYAVTIPSNTILQPGQYFLLSGQSSLPRNCGNQDSTVQVDLNWNDCTNCLDKPITTSDGLLQNGGNANEKIVLLDANLNVLDAVSRQLPVSASVSITTQDNTCGSKTFNLGSMPVSYETINNSTGIDNSYARRVDGDCGWVKTTAISARAPNKTGSTASATYSFSTLSASECQTSTGKISIEVSATNVSDLFPMTYTLAYDKDSNGRFDETDYYQYGVDSTSPSIDIGNLAYGRYRITVGSAMGCNLKTYDFFIFNCYGRVLDVKLLDFRWLRKEGNADILNLRFQNTSLLRQIELEGSTGSAFRFIKGIPIPNSNINTIVKVEAAAFNNLRIKILTEDGQYFYSPEVQVLTPISNNIYFGPNPATNQLLIQSLLFQKEDVTYQIHNGVGKIVSKGEIVARNNLTEVRIETSHLPRGTYYITLKGNISRKLFSFTFLKM